METTKIEFQKVRDFGALLNATFEFIRQNFKLLFKTTLFLAGPFILLSGVFLGIYQSALFSFDAEPQLEAFGIPFLLYVFFIILAYIMLIVVTYSFILLYNEREADGFDIDDVWSKTKSNFWMLFFTGIGYAVIVSFGIILLIIPGLYLGIALSIIYMVRLNENIGFFDAVGRCTKLVSNNWWFTFGFILVLGIIQGFIGFILYIPSYVVMFAMAFSGLDGETSSVTEIAFIITSIIAALGIILYVISIIGIAFHYYNLVERKEAPGLIDQIETIK